MIDRAERMLDEPHVRIAFGRSGLAVGFPRDPMVHVSWWVLAPLAVLVLWRRR
jgi:hypothetical protein